MVFSGLCSFWKPLCIINTLIHQAPGNRKCHPLQTTTGVLSLVHWAKSTQSFYCWCGFHLMVTITFSFWPIQLSPLFPFLHSLFSSRPLASSSNYSPVESSHRLQHSAPWCSRISMYWLHIERSWHCGCHSCYTAVIAHLLQSSPCTQTKRKKTRKITLLSEIFPCIWKKNLSSAEGSRIILKQVS